MKIFRKQFDKDYVEVINGRLGRALCQAPDDFLFSDRCGWGEADPAATLQFSLCIVREVFGRDAEELGFVYELALMALSNLNSSSTAFQFTEEDVRNWVATARLFSEAQRATPSE